MTQKIYQVDAFTDKLFGGNPAAVCPLDKWLGDEVMQNIAMENNLSETAFYINHGNRYQIRWFTPTVEVDLCGHATFAAAYVLFHHEQHKGDVIHFYSPRSGELKVTKEDDFLTLNFPADEIQSVELTPELIAGFNIRPQLAYKGKTDYLLVFKNEKEIKNLTPDIPKISELEARGVIVTAKGDTVDFVSRFFGPRAGVDEDPVTGSAHTTLTPFWANELGKTELSAIQLSQRKGHLHCKYVAPRVEISGKGKLYMSGMINVG